jgi:hypothetical protein
LMNELINSKLYSNRSIPYLHAKESHCQNQNLQGSYSSCHVRACFLSVHKMDQTALIVQRQFYTMIYDLLPGLAEISANEKQNKNIYMKKKRALPVVQSNLHAIGMYARSVQLGPWPHKSVDAICFNNQYTTSCASTR